MKDKLVPYFNTDNLEINYKEIFETLLNEKMEEYLNFVNKSIFRC